jgi:hypothetical protein
VTGARDRVVRAALGELNRVTGARDDVIRAAALHRVPRARDRVVRAAPGERLPRNHRDHHRRRQECTVEAILHVHWIVSFFVFVVWIRVTRFVDRDTA